MTNASGAARADGHLLVVDDNDDVREIIADTLRSRGYVVCTAADGATALVELARSRPSFVFLDLVMPNVSGWQVLETIGRDPDLVSIPICVFTASGLATPPAPAGYVLRKPVALRSVLAMVALHCEPSRL